MKKLLTLLFILSLSFTFIACNKEEDMKVDHYESIYPDEEVEVDEEDKFYVVQPDYVEALYDYMMDNYFSNTVNMNFKVAYVIKQNCQSFYDRSRDFMIELEIYNQMHTKYVYYFAGLMYINWLDNYTYLTDTLRDEFMSKENLVEYITNDYLAENGPYGDKVQKMRTYVPELNPLW